MGISIIIIMGYLQLIMDFIISKTTLLVTLCLFNQFHEFNFKPRTSTILQIMNLLFQE